MSYILNALRKSEQERNQEDHQVSQDLPRLPADSQSRFNINWLIFALIVVNLSLLGYFWYELFSPFQTTPVAKVPEVPVKISLTPNQTQVAQEPGAINAISDWVAARQKTVPVLIPKASEAKPPVVAQEQLKKASVKQILSKAEISLQFKQQDLPVDELHQKLVEVRETLSEKEVAVEPNLIEPKVVESGIPLLRELDIDFQRQVPSVKINVLAYDDAPDARFAIIDMVKYKIGQRINDKIQLKDILPASLVLNYAGRDFRIERP